MSMAKVEFADLQGESDWLIQPEIAANPSSALENLLWLCFPCVLVLIYGFSNSL